MAEPITERPKQLARRKAAVRFVARMQQLPGWGDACVRYLWYPEDVDGQEIEWEGPGYYVRRIHDGTWYLLGVDWPNTNNRIIAYHAEHRAEKRRRRAAGRPKVTFRDGLGIFLQVASGVLGLAQSGIELGNTIKEVTPHDTPAKDT